MATIFKKTKVLTDAPFHYCPGCGHGIVHRLVAEVIEELGIQDRTAGVAPVGCAVFAYNYFNVDMYEAAHGRAPAVATGYKRVHPENFIFTYQGDGDLASIGTAEIVQAAHRGEKITTIFINNAIYGMTGGQMAPTTLLGQKTTTSPLGRTKEHSGAPIRISEMLATIDGSAYIERTAVNNTANIIKTKNAIKKAFQAQIDGKGFSLVEVLSTCPTNWGKSPVESMEWLEQNMIPYYPLGVKKEVYAMLEKNIFAGFGGQGVLLMGQLLAKAGMLEDKNTSWIPSYGPEMRGGTANCSIIISDKEISSPIVTRATTVIAMNRPSLDKFEDAVLPGGKLFINSSIIDVKSKRTDIDVYYVPCNEIANELGNSKVANMVMLGAYLEKCPCVAVESVLTALLEKLGERKAHLIPMNREAFAKGAESVR